MATFYAREVAEARRFHLEPRTRDDLAVASAGWERCLPSYRNDRLTFPWFALELVVDGHGDLVLGGVEHLLRPGTLFTYGPGVPHRIHGDPARPLLKYFLDLHGSGAADLLADQGLAPGAVRHLPNLARVRAILDLLIEAGEDGAPAVATPLARAAVAAIGAAAVEPERAADPAYATYARSRAWLELHGATVPTQEAAAAAIGISAAHLCRLFRRYDRLTPWALVRQRRLQRAADHLVAGDAPIAAIASAAGYPDPFHFTRAFRRRFGVSPRQFRQMGR